VAGVLGRIEDLVKTRDGQSLGMFTYRTLKEIPGLKESQVIQHDYDRFTVNFVPEDGADLPEIQRLTTERFTRVLGETPQITFTPLDELPRGPSGKVRLVKSHV
jgi:hypothetical protein